MGAKGCGELQVQLREFYGFVPATGDLPGQAAILGRTAGCRRPAGRAALWPAFRRELFASLLKSLHHNFSPPGRQKVRLDETRDCKFKLHKNPRNLRTFAS